MNNRIKVTKDVKRRSAVEQALLIRQDVLAVVASANSRVAPLRQVTDTSAVEVVWRALNESRHFSTFASRRRYAFNELKSFINLAQGHVSYSSVSKYSDLLTTAHPFSAAPHAMTASALADAQMQWYLADPRISEEHAPLLASAFSVESTEEQRKYATTRLGATKDGAQVLEAITAAFSGDGNSYWQRRMRAMRQRRDRLGRFAEEGGGMRVLVSLPDGSVRWLTGRSIAADPNSNTFDVETPRGIVRVPAGSAEGIEAYLPGKESPDGYSPVPARTTAADASDIIKEADLKIVDSPAGWEAVKDFQGNPNEKAFTDGVYVVAQSEDANGKKSFRLIDENNNEIGTGDNWTAMLDQSMTDALGGAERPTELTDDMLLNGLDEIANNDTAGAMRDVAKNIAAFLRDGTAPSDRTPEQLAEQAKRIANSLGSQKDTRPNQRSFDEKFWGFEDDFRKGSEAITKKLSGQEIQQDKKEEKQQPVAKLPSETAPALEVPQGAYELEKGDYIPSGRVNEDSTDFTDDPEALATKFKAGDIAKALNEALIGDSPDRINGLGYGGLEFNEGIEEVPAEALYFALKKKGKNADKFVADTYKKGQARLDRAQEPAVAEEPSTPETPEVTTVPEVKKEDVADALDRIKNIPEVSEITPAKGKQPNEDVNTPEEDAQEEDPNYPALIEGLTEDELQSWVDSGFDHVPFLPKNEDITFPDDYTQIDPNPVALDEITTVEEGDSLNQDGVPVGWTNDPYALAQNFDTQELIDNLEFALEPRDENSKYTVGATPFTYIDENGDEFYMDVAPEFIRDALQLQGEDTNEILQEIADRAWAAQAENKPIASDVEEGRSSGDLTDEEMQAMMDGEGIQSEKIATPDSTSEAFTPNENRETIPYDSKQFVPNDPANPNGPGKVESISGESDIIDYAGRKVVVVDVNGVKVPFYLSTGHGGKKDVTSGKWYPVFGLGSDGWLNKLSGEQINDYYGSPELRAQAEWLDANIGDIRDDKSVPKAGTTGAHVDFINQDMNPTDNSTADTRKNLEANIADVKSRIEQGRASKPELDNPQNPSGIITEAQPEPEKIGEPNAERASRLNARADELVATGDISGAAVYRLRAHRDGEAVRLYTSAGEGNVSLPIGNVETVNSFTPSTEATKIMQDGRITPLTMHELKASPENAAIFHQAITDAKNTNEHGASVYVYSPEEYADMRMFLSPDGKSGFALKGTDLVSVFKGDTQDKRVAHAMVPLAIQEGAVTGDAFDTVLPKIYGDHGLKTVARLPWDDSQAPSDWSKDTFSESNNGEPDVVFMAYDPEDTAGYTAGQGQMFSDYGDAVDAQQRIVSGVQVPLSPAGTPLSVKQSNIPFSELEFGDYIDPAQFDVEVPTGSHSWYMGFSPNDAEIIQDTDENGVTTSSVTGYITGFDAYGNEIDRTVVVDVSSDAQKFTTFNPSSLKNPNDKPKVTDSPEDIWGINTENNLSSQASIVKFSAPVTSMQPGDVTIGDNFTITEVGTEPDARGKISVKGYFPGHEVQEKFWKNTTPIDFVRGVPEENMPMLGDLPKINKPQYTDFRGGSNSQEFKLAYARYRGMINAARGRWTNRYDVASYEFNPTTDLHRVKVHTNELKPGDVMADPTKGNFVIVSVSDPDPSNPEHTDAIEQGLLIVKGYYPGHELQDKKWKPRQEGRDGVQYKMDVIRNSKLPDSGPLPPINQGETIDGRYVRNEDPEFVKQYNRNIADAASRYNFPSDAPEVDYPQEINPALREAPRAVPTREPKSPFEVSDPFAQGAFAEMLREAGSWENLREAMKGMTFTFFDYETTGLDPNTENPVQLGAVKIKDGVVVDRFNMYINPGSPLGDWSKDNLKNGDGEPLTDEFLQQQASMAEVHQAFADWTGADTILGAMNSNFDREFLEIALSKTGVEFTPTGYIDPQSLARAINADAGEPKKKVALKLLARQYGVPLENWHSADADAEATASIFGKLLDRAQAENLANGQFDVDAIAAKHAEDLEFFDSVTYPNYLRDLEAWNMAQAVNNALAGQEVDTDQLISDAKNATPIITSESAEDIAGTQAFKDSAAKPARLGKTEWVLNDANTRPIDRENVRVNSLEIGDFMSTQRGDRWSQVVGVEEVEDGRFTIHRVDLESGDEFVSGPYWGVTRLDGIRRPISANSLSTGEEGDPTLTDIIEPSEKPATRLEHTGDNIDNFNAETTIEESADGALTATTKVFDENGDLVGEQENIVNSIEEAQKTGDSVLQALHEDIIALTLEMSKSMEGMKPTKEEKPSQISDVTYPTQRSEEIVSNGDGVSHKVTVVQIPKRFGGGYEVGVFKDDGSGNWVEAEKRFQGPNIANFQRFETLEDAKSASKEVSKFIKPVVETPKKPARSKQQKQEENRARIQDGAYLIYQSVDGEGSYVWQNPDGSTAPLDQNDPQQAGDLTIGRVFGQSDARVVEGGEAIRDALSTISIEETLDMQPEISERGGGFGPAGTPMLGRVVRPAGHIKTSNISDPSGRELSVELQLGGGFEGDPEHFNIIIRDPRQGNREISHEVASSREEAEELFESLKANIADGTTVIASSPYGQDILDAYGTFDPNRPPSPNDSSAYVSTDLLPNEEEARYRVIGEKPWQKYSNDMFLYADGTHQARIGDRVVHQYKGWRKLLGRDRGVGTIQNWEVIANPGDRARIGYAYVTFEDGSWGVFSTDFLFLEGRSADTANPLNAPPVNPEAAAMIDPPKPNIRRPFVSTGRRGESTVRRLETEEKYTLELRRDTGEGSRGGGGGEGRFITNVVPYVSKTGTGGRNGVPIPQRAVARTREAYDLWLERQASVDEYRRAMGLPQLTSRIVTLANPGDRVLGPIWRRATGLGGDMPPTPTPQAPTPTPNTPTPTDISPEERRALLENYARMFNANRDNGLRDAEVEGDILRIFSVGDDSVAQVNIEWAENRQAYSLQTFSEGSTYGEIEYVANLQEATNRARQIIDTIEQENIDSASTPTSEVSYPERGGSFNAAQMNKFKEAVQRIFIDAGFEPDVIVNGLSDMDINFDNTTFRVRFDATGIDVEGQYGGITPTQNATSALAKIMSDVKGFARSRDSSNIPTSTPLTNEERRRALQKSADSFNLRNDKGIEASAGQFFLKLEDNNNESDVNVASIEWNEDRKAYSVDVENGFNTLETEYIPNLDVAIARAEFRLLALRPSQGDDTSTGSETPDAQTEAYQKIVNAGFQAPGSYAIFNMSTVDENLKGIYWARRGYENSSNARAVAITATPEGKFRTSAWMTSGLMHQGVNPNFSDDFDTLNEAAAQANLYLAGDSINPSDQRDLGPAGSSPQVLPGNPITEAPNNYAYLRDIETYPARANALPGVSRNLGIRSSTVTMGVSMTDKVTGVQGSISYNAETREYTAIADGVELPNKFDTVDDAGNAVIQKLVERRDTIEIPRSTGGTASRPYPLAPREKRLNAREVEKLKGAIEDRVSALNATTPVEVSIASDDNSFAGLSYKISVPEVEHEMILMQNTIAGGWNLIAYASDGSVTYDLNFKRTEEVLDRIKSDSRTAIDKYYMDRVSAQRTSLQELQRNLFGYEASTRATPSVDSASGNSTWNYSITHKPEGFNNGYKIDVNINPKGESTGSVSVISRDGTSTKFDVAPSADFSSLTESIKNKVQELADANGEETMATKRDRARAKSAEILATEQALELPQNPVPIYGRFILQDISDVVPVQQIEFDGTVPGVLNPNFDRVDDKPVLTPNGDYVSQTYFQDLGWEAEKAAQIAHAGVSRTSMSTILDLAIAGDRSAVSEAMALGMGKGNQFGRALKVSGVRTTEMNINSRRSGTIRVSVTVTDTTSGNYYSGDRTFTFKDGKLFDVHNDILKIEGKNSSGFASLYNQYCENWYIANSADQITVGAAGGGSWTGAYVWAITGFNWYSPYDGYQRLSSMNSYLEAANDNSTYVEGAVDLAHARADIERMKQQAFDAYGVTSMSELQTAMRNTSELAPTFPTPREMAMLGWNPELRDTGQKWFGRNYMIDNGWSGRKVLKPTSTERVQNHTYDVMKKATDVAVANKLHSFENNNNIKKHFATRETYQGVGEILAPYADELTRLTGYEGRRSVSQLSPPAKAALGKYLATILAEEDSPVFRGDDSPSGQATNNSIKSDFVDILDALQQDRLFFEPNREKLSMAGETVKNLPSEIFDTSMTPGETKNVFNQETGEFLPFTITKLVQENTTNPADGPTVSGAYAGASDIWLVQSIDTKERFYVKNVSTESNLQSEIASNVLGRALGIVGLPVVDRQGDSNSTRIITSELGTNLSIPAINTDELVVGANSSPELDTTHLVRMDKSEIFNINNVDVAGHVSINNALGMLALDAIIQNEDRGSTNVMMVRGNDVPNVPVHGNVAEAWIPIPFDHADAVAIRTAIEQTSNGYQSPYDYLATSLGVSNDLGKQIFDRVGPVTFKMLMDKRIQQALQELKGRYSSGYMSQEVLDMISDRASEMLNYTTDNWSDIYG